MTTQLDSLTEHLLSFYKETHMEIDRLKSKHQDVAYNYLRTVRNEIIKLLMLRNQITPESTECSNVIAQYMADNQYRTSSPDDRNKLNPFWKTHTKHLKHADTATDKLHSHFSALLNNVKISQSTNKNFHFSPLFTTKFEKMHRHYNQAPLKKNDDDPLYATLMVKLENLINLTDKPILDTDSRSQDTNPYFKLANALRDKLVRLKANEDRINQVYLSLHLALIDFNSLTVSGQGYYNFELAALIKTHLREIEKRNPLIQAKMRVSFSTELQWQEYYAATNLGIDKVKEKALELYQEGDSAASKELNDYAAEMRKNTDAYFYLTTKTERELHFPEYKTHMDAICNRASKSQALKKHSTVKAIFENIKFIVLTLGLGLIWMHYTQDRRSSFWINQNPLIVMKSATDKLHKGMKTKAAPSPKQHRGSSTGKID